VFNTEEHTLAPLDTVFDPRHLVTIRLIFARIEDLKKRQVRSPVPKLEQQPT
jgi:hypothetical protein